MTNLTPFPHIGRQTLIERVLDRLQRPNDLLQSPKDFIQPGFYGLGGLGKSRLLQAIAHAARPITPYVVFIDFAPNPNQPIPGTPLALIKHLIDALDALDLAQRNRWNPLDRQSRFTACRQTWAQAQQPFVNVQVQQTASLGGVIDASAPSVHVQTGAETAVPTALAAAFQQALAQLRHPVPVRDKLGVLTKPKPRPLILLIFDTVEEAPKPIRLWLPTGLLALLGSPSTAYHAMPVLAGRERVDPLLTTALPAFTPAEAEDFLYEYAWHWQQRQHQAPPSGGISAATVTPQADLLRQASPVRQQIVAWSEGVPLLLQTLAALALLDADNWQHLQDTPQRDHAERFAYFYEQYLTRLAATAHRQSDQRLWARYHLLTYAPVPRQLSGPDQLRALLQDLPGTAFDAKTGYDQLYTQLQAESYVQSTDHNYLRIHALVRDGALQSLRRQQPDTWQELHQRAAHWFGHLGNLVEQLYHSAQIDYATALPQLHQHITAALTQQQWATVQTWLAMADELPLQPPDAQWIHLYKAQLAWHEGNQALALERLTHLTQAPALDAAVTTALADWLEQTLGYTPKTTITQSFSPHLLLWWAQIRQLPALAATILLGLGDVARRQDRLEAAQDYLARALGLYEQIQDQRGTANALYSLSDVAQRQDRLEAAQDYLARALGLYEQIQDQRGTANILHSLGDVAQRQDRLEAAQDYLARALELFEQIQNQRGTANALRSLGDVALRQARLDTAQHYYEQVLRLSEQIQNQRSTANALRVLGDVALRQARLAAAQHYYEQALHLYEQIKNQRGAANALCSLGDVALQQNQLNAAQHYYEQALRLYEQIKDQRGAANALVGLGDIALRQTRLDVAQGYYEQALHLYEQIQDQRGTPNVLRSLGDVALRQARLDVAQGYYEQALHLYEQIQDQFGTPNALLSLGDVALQQARLDAAQHYYEQALRLYKQINDQFGTANALLSLGDVTLRQAQLHTSQEYYRAAWEIYASIADYLKALNNIALATANETLNQAEQQRAAGEHQSAQQLATLAATLYGWGATLLAQLPVETPLPNNISVRMQALQARLAEFGVAPHINWEKDT